MVAAASQRPRRRRATAGGARTTAGGAVAAEARGLVRGAVGDAAGLTIKGQVRRAAENLGYPADCWRVREAFYGRAGAWSAAALDDLRARSAAWQGRGEPAHRASGLVRRLRGVRADLARLDRELASIEAEVAALAPVGDGGGAS